MLKFAGVYLRLHTVVFYVNVWLYYKTFVKKEQGN